VTILSANAGISAGTPSGVRCGGALSRGGGRWPYPALRRFNPFGIGTGSGTYITPTVIPTHTVMPAQAGTQWSAKRDQNNDSYQVPTRPVMPAQAGIQRGDEGDEGIDLACILFDPQVGLVVRDDYSMR